MSISRKFITEKLASNTFLNDVNQNEVIIQRLEEARNSLFKKFFSKLARYAVAQFRKSVGQYITGVDIHDPDDYLVDVDVLLGRLVTLSLDPSKHPKFKGVFDQGFFREFGSEFTDPIQKSMKMLSGWKIQPRRNMREIWIKDLLIHPAWSIATKDIRPGQVTVYFEFDNSRFNQLVLKYRIRS